MPLTLFGIPKSCPLLCAGHPAGTEQCVVLILRSLSKALCATALNKVLETLLKRK